MNDRRFLVWGLLIAMAVVPSVGAQPGGQATAVTVDAVRRESVQEHRRVTGELRAVRRSRVATQEEGLVVDLPVREGRRVAAGDVLAVLDSRRLEIALQQAEADVLAVQSILDERQATQSWREEELELYRKSAERGAANVKEMLDAEALARIAAAITRQGRRQLEVTKAKAELLRERLEDMTVVAPFDGVVVAKHAELGEWVATGAPLAELVSVGEIEAWLDVPQRYFEAAAEGPVEIAIAFEASARVVRTARTRVVPLVDPRARSFYVVATLENAGGRLTPGMSLSAWIPTAGSIDRLTVSKDAVLHNDAGPFVYVARGGGPPGVGPGTGPAQAVPQKVKTLFPLGDRMVVEARGLEPGDLVVVEGNERLFPMMPIEPVERGDGPAAATEGQR